MPECVKNRIIKLLWNVLYIVGQIFIVPGRQTSTSIK